MIKRLRVKIERKSIVIRLPIECLSFIVPVALDESFGCPPHNISLESEDKLAVELVRELKAEAENGATLVTDMFDKAIKRAVENGAEGLNYGDPR